tara:strand:+ start:68 stop:607 length:540 start_codon:yes stop_codon:yes gene_type:complete
MKLIKKIDSFDAGEIIFNCIHGDGIESKFDEKLINLIYQAVKIPFTIVGGALFSIIYSSEGNPLAYRGMIFYDDRAWDLGAATTSEGRNLLASYYLTIELIKKSKLLGIKNYNFGAIDEVSKPGVYHFKKGIAQNEFKYSGEWEWSNLPLMRFFINISIKLLMSDRLRKIIPFINNLKF